MAEKLTPPKATPNTPITAAGMNELMRAVLRRIRGGFGVNVEQYGDGIVINARMTGRNGMSIPWVTALPEIPTTPLTTVSVFWASDEQIEGATGDGQKWTASTGDDRWRPETKYTDLDGVPVE